MGYFQERFPSQAEFPLHIFSIDNRFANWSQPYTDRGDIRIEIFSFFLFYRKIYERMTFEFSIYTGKTNLISQEINYFTEQISLFKNEKKASMHFIMRAEG